MIVLFVLEYGVPGIFLAICLKWFVDWINSEEDTSRKFTLEVHQTTTRSTSQRTNRNRRTESAPQRRAVKPAEQEVTELERMIAQRRELDEKIQNKRHTIEGMVEAAASIDSNPNSELIELDRKIKAAEKRKKAIEAKQRREEEDMYVTISSGRKKYDVD